MRIKRYEMGKSFATLTFKYLVSSSSITEKDPSWDVPWTLWKCKIKLPICRNSWRFYYLLDKRFKVHSPSAEKVRCFSLVTFHSCCLFISQHGCKKKKIIGREKENWSRDSTSTILKKTKYWKTSVWMGKMMEDSCPGFASIEFWGFGKSHNLSLHFVNQGKEHVKWYSSLRFCGPKIKELSSVCLWI